MRVKNSTQQVRRPNVKDYKTEPGMQENYSEEIVENFILNAVKRKVFNINEKDPSDSDLLTDDYISDEESNLGEVTRLYGFKDSNQHSIKTQRWIGYVITIENGKFISRLDDLTNPGTSEIGEFDVSDVSPEDLQLLEKGALFYWSVGDIMSNGQLKKESTIRFKRPSPWTNNDLNNVEDSIDKILKNISWD